MARPQDIGPARDVYEGEAQTSAWKLREFRQRLLGTKNKQPNHLMARGLAELVLRRDLPPLEDVEIQAIIAEINRHFTNHVAAVGHPGTCENLEVRDLVPWLARYAPREFSSAIFARWKVALDNKDPVAGLLGLEGLFPATDEGGQLVQTILKRGQFLVEQANFAAVAPEITETLLLHGNLDQLMTWLRLIETKGFIRGISPAVSILPLPETFRALAPGGLAELAKREFERAFALAKRAPSKDIANLAASHWLHIYSYTADASKEVGDWALRLADEIGSKADLSLPLFFLLSESRDPGVFWRALAHPALREFQTGFVAWRWGRRLPPDVLKQLSFESLNSFASLTVSGCLLSLSGQEDELRKWGSAVAKASLLALENNGAGWSPKSKIQFQVERDTGLARVDIPSLPDGGTTLHDLASPVWGIDRQTSTTPPSQEDYDQTFTQLHSDLKRRHELIRREFVGFNAAGPLLCWSKLEPVAFVAFANQFLKNLEGKHFSLQLDFHFFAASVKIGLLRIRSRGAARSGELDTFAIGQGVTCSETGLSWEVEELWDFELNGSPAITKVRDRLLNEALDDETLLRHAVAANACGNQEQIVRFADGFLVAQTARDRALGATLLAFQGDAASAAKLERCILADPSYWVRDHVTWCMDVCATEQACRRRYREILLCQSLPELALGLAELGPAFTPLSRAWRSRIEIEARWPGSDRRMEIYLRNFWYHWNSTSAHREKVAICGRKLREFCRGERLRDGITNRQAPWWKLEAEEAL